MNLTGGVIIIGSLLWDNLDRRKWRKNSLDSESKISVPLKIRYGRVSGSRYCTHTMIFSNDPNTKPGQGYVVGFRKRIRGPKTLEKQAIALACAEGIWTRERQRLTCDWGAVGILVNENKPCAEKIRSLWKKLFQEQRSGRYCHSQYCFVDEEPIITDEGFLQLDPKPEMSNFDLLMATPTVPSPDRALTPREVADRMIKQNYRVYFNGNIANNIATFQDDKIKAFLTPKA